jgi:hypothetical protein
MRTEEKNAWCTYRHASNVKAHQSTMRDLGVASPNKSLQRSVNHKVLGRGRVVLAHWRAPRARVLTGQSAAAELGR